MMNWWKNPVYIALMAISGLAVVCLCLSFAWGFFTYGAVVCIGGAFGIGAYITIKGYLAHRKAVRRKRYTDAYLYAEEQGRPSAIHKFKYPRKQEAQIKWGVFNKLLMCVVCVGGFGLAVYLLVAMIINS